MRNAPALGGVPLRRIFKADVPETSMISCRCVRSIEAGDPAITGKKSAVVFEECGGVNFLAISLKFPCSPAFCMPHEGSRPSWRR